MCIRQTNPGHDICQSINRTAQAIPRHVDFLKNYITNPIASAGPSPDRAQICELLEGLRSLTIGSLEMAAKHPRMCDHLRDLECVQSEVYGSPDIFIPDSGRGGLEYFEKAKRDRKNEFLEARLTIKYETYPHLNWTSILLATYLTILTRQSNNYSKLYLQKWPGVKCDLI